MNIHRKQYKKYNDMNYLDRNEFNFEPSQKVLDAVKNFDPKDLCFYTRIYDEGKKSVISVRVSEIYGVPEEQVLLAYGGEEILKNAIHYFLMEGNNKTILIPEFSWWYYNRVASALDRFRALPPEQRSRLRRIEHLRWTRFHLLNNWVWGPVRDNARRIHPALVAFDDLSPADQAKDDYAWELLSAAAELPEPIE